MLVAIGFNLLSPLVVRHAVDSIEGGISIRLLALYALAIVLVALTQGLFTYLMRWKIIGMSRRIEYELRNDFFSHLQRQSMTFFGRNNTGDLMARATNDLNAVRMLVGPGIMYSANTLVLTIAATVLMVSINPKLTFYVLCPLPLMSLVGNRLLHRIHRIFTGIQENFSRITTHAQENLSGIRVIKAYVQERSEIRRFQGLNREYMKRNLDLARTRGFLHGSIVSLVGLGGAFLVFFGGRQVIAGDVTLGDFVAFSLYYTRLVWPMIALGWVLNLYQQGMASLRRMNGILEQEPDIRDRPGVAAASGEKLRGAIEFRNLTFGYNGAAVLKDINLNVPRGSSLAVVGPTGSGKTTLINLVPRLQDPAPGQLFIDGRDIHEIPLEALRRHIGYVPQDTFLFSETVKENICLGVDETPEVDIEEAAKRAQLFNDVENFNDRFDTEVGERGVTLSGGQKQRTALARAIIRKPEILILDDALSAVDTYTEEAILQGLKEVMRGRTSIIISHRISTVKHADHIIVLDEGRIVEEGDHNELVALDGLYADIYRKQLLEDAIEAAA